MKRIVLSFAIILMATLGINAQKFFTKTGKIDFVSNAPMEKIEATNNAVTCVLDTETGKMQFAVLIKAFKFEKALMQEHFNENYMESSKFPKATFSGTIDNISTVNFEQDGEYPVNVSGTLTIHGVTNEVTTPGAITISKGQVNAVATFSVLVADYDIKIPKVVRENIAKEVEISVDTNLEPLIK